VISGARAAVLVLVLGRASVALAEPRCVLLVASEPAPDSAVLDAARRSLAPRCQFLGDPAVKAALESFAHEPSARSGRARR